jgi:hypothetical protein
MISEAVRRLVYQNTEFITVVSVIGLWAVITKVMLTVAEPRILV